MSATFPANSYIGPQEKIRAEMKNRPPAARRASPWADLLFSALAHGAAWLTLALLAGIIVSLLVGAAPAIKEYGLSFLWTSEWDPVQNRYGGLVMIYGTLMTSFIALLIAVPVSFGIALFLTELSPAWLKRPLGTAIELLAAIPSIVYGMWGLFVLGPLMSDYVQPFLKSTLGFLPFFSGASMGIGMLTAGLVLTLMIIPFISSVTRDVFLMVPQPLKEAAYGLGCTTWEVVRDIMIPYGKKGIAGAVFLGMGRALGETMAVTFVIGNAYHLSWSLFAPGNSIASTLANEFTEADGTVYLSSLIELGLVLFLITLVILSLAQFWLRRGQAGRA